MQYCPVESPAASSQVFSEETILFLLRGPCVSATSPVGCLRGRPGRFWSPVGCLRGRPGRFFSPPTALAGAMEAALGSALPGAESFVRAIDNQSSGLWVVVYRFGDQDYRLETRKFRIRRKSGEKSDSARNQSFYRAIRFGEKSELPLKGEHVPISERRHRRVTDGDSRHLGCVFLVRIVSSPVHPCSRRHVPKAPQVHFTTADTVSQGPRIDQRF